MIALGVVAAVWLGGKRLVQRGIGTTDDMSAIAMWAVPSGVIGARLYHVITDWQLFRNDLGAIVQIWKGGLGIWGGIALGTLVGIGVARKRGLPVALLLTCVAPALPLAQSIGRWGNWFNQELFGRPTTLPWGLEVSASTAQSAGYAAGTQFHPTYLYESIACLLLCGALIVLDNVGSTCIGVSRCVGNSTTNQGGHAERIRRQAARRVRVSTDRCTHPHAATLFSNHPLHAVGQSAPNYKSARARKRMAQH